MSWVANVLVSASMVDRETVDAFDRWIRDSAPRREGMPGTGVGSLKSLTDDASRWGGAKYPECHLWAGAINHADVDALVQQFGAVAWKVPAAAQLLVMDQEQTYFRLWMIREGQLFQFAPAPPADDSAW